MGKKDAQRTKGNAKVASSARSAQILGTSNTGFIGFGTTAEAGFVPLMQSDDGVPPDFRLVLRKMQKKDSTTKLKALQEFLDLSSKSSDEDMISVLAFWPAVYNKLAVDTDHRIRELAHTALKSVVTAVGKNLAPHLKSLSGVWFIGQSDSHVPAAQAAQLAWQAAFPDPVKSTGAKDFCQEEILSLIEDNLIRATPQTLSDPKTTPVEEMESKYERTLCMSLSAYIQLLNSVNKLDQTRHSKLLDSQKFWKFNKNKSVKVRRSFFSTVSQLCDKLAESLSSRGCSVVPSVLTCLGDLEAGVSVWEAAVQVLCTVQDPWSQVNSRKAVYPGVWNVLSSAAGGRPSTIFPFLLPFLSKINLEDMQDNEMFVNRWFSSLKEGLSSLQAKKTTLKDTDTVIKTMMECIFYVCNKSGVAQGLKGGLVRDLLVPLVTETTLRPEVCHSLVNYLMFWDRTTASSGDSAHCNQLFWSCLQYFCVQEQTLNPALSLYKSLASKPEGKNIVELNRIFSVMWTHQMDKLKSGEEVDRALNLLSSILSNLDTPPELVGSEDELVKVYNQIILKLLGNLELEDAVASFTWSLACTVNTDKGLQILDSFTTSSRPVAVAKLVELAVRSGSSRELAAGWLVSPVVQQVVRDSLHHAVQQLIAGQSSKQENVDTLKLVLKCGVSLPEDSQLYLMETVTHNIVSHPSKVKLVEYLCDIVLLLANMKETVVTTSKTGGEMLKVIFNAQTWDTSEAVNKKLEACWSSVAKIYPDFVDMLAIQVSTELRDQLSLPHLECLVNKSRVLTNIVSDKKPEEIVKFLTNLIPNQDVNLTEVVWYPVIFHHKLFYASCSERLEECLFKQSVAESKDLIPANTSLVLVSVLTTFHRLEEINMELEERTVMEDERISLPDSLINSDLVDQLLGSIVSVVYMQNLVLDANTSTDMKTLESRLTAAATGLFSKLSKRNLDIIEMKLFQKCKMHEIGMTLGLSWLLGITYRYSDWDLRLNRFLSPEDENITENCNTLVTLLRLSSRFNIGSASLASYISLATAKLLSIQGLKTDEGTRLLWFIWQTLQLVRPGSRLHISGASDLANEVSTLLTVINQWKQDNEHELLYTTDVSLVPWSVINRVCSVINMLNITVARFHEFISSEIWDLITCSLVQWVSSLDETADSLCSRPGPLMFGVAVAKLTATVGKALARPGSHPALSYPPLSEGGEEGTGNVKMLPAKLRDEWEEFFAEGIFSVLVPLYIKVSNGKEELYSCTLLCTSLGEAVVNAPLPLLLQSELPPLYLVQDVDAVELPDNITFLLNHFGPKLSSSCRSFQVTAAHVLAAVTKEIPSHVDTASDGEECEIPRRFLENIEQGELLLSSLLAEFSISDPVPDIPTGTVAFSHSLGYLLCWRVILCLLENSSDVVRPRYSQFLDNKEHISKLLGNIFKLLPRNQSRLEVVFTPGDLEVTTESSSWELQQLAGSCWVQVCRHLPAFARQWWSRLDKESQIAVEKITSNHVTPALWAKEVDIINSSDKSENLNLKVRETVREVVATYTIDEGSMELVVTLPSNYPLGGLQVDSARRVGVETGQWRKWMLQLTTFLTHQNGSIYEGLNLWKKNVDKRFEGVEECYICFYILHGSNHQLPKLGCRTCKKKFHSACLYKWFSTSNNSTCPLCRNLF